MKFLCSVYNLLISESLNTSQMHTWEGKTHFGFKGLTCLELESF